VRANCGNDDLDLENLSRDVLSSTGPYDIRLNCALFVLVFLCGYMFLNQQISFCLVTAIGYWPKCVLCTSRQQKSCFQSCSRVQQQLVI